jgi:hypothetical protein
MSSFSSRERIIRLGLLALSLVVSGVLGLHVASAEQERAATLAERIPFSGEVRAAYLVVVDSSGAEQASPASWIQSEKSNEVVCIGRVSLAPTDSTINALFVVVGAQGEVRSVFRSFGPEELPPAVFLSVQELRDRLVERRGLLRQLSNEVRTLDDRLEALQEDADSIANVSKIVGAEDELEVINGKIAQVDAAYKSVEQRKGQMKTRPVPLNTQTRETELVQQLAELSTALSATETSALQRISNASGELQEKLKLIEETKDEHVSLLEEELASIQREKKP